MIVLLISKNMFLDKMINNTLTTDKMIIVDAKLSSCIKLLNIKKLYCEDFIITIINKIDINIIIDGI